MKGGVKLFHGSGAAARAYVEADRSRADEYYLGADQAVAEYAVIDATGEVTAARSLSADEYEAWVDWVNPDTGESMGTPRKPGKVRRGSPLFAEMTINAPKSLSVAAALHPDVSEALDATQRDAAREIQHFLGQHSVTLAGPRGAQEVLPVEHMQTVAITHKTSRAGDPHRHIHFQIGTRVWAGGKWRALTTAALTLVMRDREHPGDVFDRLATMGLVTLHADEEAAREHITAHAHDGEAITVATNDEATELNEHIRAGRVERGEVDDTMTTTGSDGLSIGAGDLIQTRKNSSDLGVANRQQWIVQHVTDEGSVYAREVSGGGKHSRTVALPAEYVSEWAHLSYAATAYGVQGATVDASHTALSEATSAAGVYVGMTRGRQQNQLHVVAADMADARARFVEAMERDPADRGLDHATAQAIDAVQGLVSDGPVQLITEELARLTAEAERAERAAERWEQTAARFDAQRATHKTEDDEHADVLRHAEDEAARIRAEIAEPLTVQAEADGTTYLDAVEREAAASSRLATVGRLGRRKARAEHRQTSEHTRTVRARVRETWGEPPRTTDTLPEWAARQAERRAEADPRVIDAAQHVEAARADRDELRQRHEQERRALLVSEYGPQAVMRHRVGMRLPNPAQQAGQAHQQATALRAEADYLRALPIRDAAARIETTRAEHEARQQALAERERQLREPTERDPRRNDPRHDGPARGL
ncbi:relaxase domain-containing protein [Neomicrococcus lactis]|uniref:relaxase domain-containing protein n=1 Tax=Neomicrococcus lactis TaxID=732241 RepID=UPI002301B583|nr:relaxase domain-containing protein [Neomicrococcus lactis]